MMHISEHRYKYVHKYLDFYHIMKTGNKSNIEWTYFTDHLMSQRTRKLPTDMWRDTMPNGTLRSTELETGFRILTYPAVKLDLTGSYNGSLLVGKLLFITSK